MKPNALSPRNQKRQLSFWPGSIVLLTLTLIAASPVRPYGSDGKRNPFVNPKASPKPAPAQTVQPPPLSQRPPGPAGLLISEVVLVGSAAGNGKRLVMIKGRDDFAYLASKGTRLFDGKLTEITDQEVIFQRQILDTAGNIKIQKVVKRHSGEENEK